MAGAWGPSARQAPSFPADAHELRAVLAAQGSDLEVLRARLAATQQECALLQQRLHDAQGELLLAAEATASATERLGTHAARQSLVLAAGVERSGAERAALEHELSRAEAMVHERDMEIRRLRQQSAQLEALLHHGDVQIKGLEAANAASGELAREAVDEISVLLHDLRGDLGAAASAGRGPSPQEVRLGREVEELLAEKRAEHARLKRQAEALTMDALRLDDEETELAQRVAAFEHSLRAKQDHMGMQDKRASQEVAELRSRCEELRRLLQSEQRESVAMDQRAALQPQAGAEVEAVRREMAALLSTLHRLTAQLRSRGRTVCSAEVPGDALDAAVHAVLRSASDAGSREAPPVVWRLSHGHYLLGERLVEIYQAGGQLIVRDGSGLVSVLADHLGCGRRAAPVRSSYPPLPGSGPAHALGASLAGRTVNV